MLFKGRGALQDIDHLSLLKPLCKFAAEVTKIRDIVPTLRKAINIALSGTPGKIDFCDCSKPNFGIVLYIIVALYIR